MSTDPHADDYKASADGIIGADRMKLGLPIIPNYLRGDMDMVADLKAENAAVVSEFTGLVERLRAEVERLKKALADTVTCSSDKIIRYRKALEEIPKIATPNSWQAAPYVKACTVAKKALNHEH